MLQLEFQLPLIPQTPPVLSILRPAFHIQPKGLPPQKKSLDRQCRGYLQLSRCQSFEPT